MPKSKNIYKYPSTMLDTLESLAETHHPATFVYESQRKAEIARFDYYGLIYALKHSGHSLWEEVRGLKFILQALKDNPHEKRVLTISFVEDSPDVEVYKRLAEQHAADAALCKQEEEAKLPPDAIIVELPPSTAELLGVDKPPNNSK